MSKRIKMEEEEYAIAMFEDGTAEMIPRAWIQEYLRKGEHRDGDEDEAATYASLGNAHVFQGQASENETDRQKKNEEISKLLSEQSGHFEAIAKEIASIKDVVQKIQTSVEAMAKASGKGEEVEVDLLKPADTLEEFLAIEDHIKTKDNYDEMLASLSKIGGKTLEMTTRKIWNKLCTTQLASKICWTGANGKHCLKQMLLNQLVRDSVLATHLQGKESDVQKATMLWFSHAKDRLRSRKLC